MNSRSLIGSWTLEKFEIEDPQGSISPWGVNASGLLIYSADGRMSVSINADPEGGEAAGPNQLLDAMLFYAGTYEMISGQIVHHVSHASDRSRIGQDMVRDAVLDGETLTITAKGGYGTSRLVWRRNAMS